jgi:hypothetical protein
MLQDVKEILPAIAMFLDRCGVKLRIVLHIILLSQVVSIGAVKATLYCGE